MSEALKELYLPQTTAVFGNILRIEHASWDVPMLYVANTEDIVVSGETFVARDFSFTPPDSSSEDDSAQITIDDVDRTLAWALQQVTSGVTVTLSCIRLDQPSIRIDGPYSYSLDSFKKDSASGKATLELTRQGFLNYTASKDSYTNLLFPGVFG